MAYFNINVMENENICENFFRTKTGYHVIYNRNITMSNQPNESEAYVTQYSLEFVHFFPEFYCLFGNLG